MSHKNLSNTERTGVHAVGHIFEKEFGWLFREQLTSDFGIDAQVEIADSDGPTGKLIALQIKSGSSYFSQKRSQSIVFRGETRHLEYWTHHCLPVFLVLHDPATSRTLFQRIERRLVTFSKNGWTILVPEKNGLNVRARDEIANATASDPEGLRRFRFAADLELIKEIGRHKKTYLVWQDWINKSLNFRSPCIYYGKLRPGKPDRQIGAYAASRNLYAVMQGLFPWATYSYAQPIKPHDECVEHVLSLKLRPEARAYIQVVQER